MKQQYKINVIVLKKVDYIVGNSKNKGCEFVKN